MNQLTFILEIFAQILSSIGVIIIVFGTLFFIGKALYDIFVLGETEKVFKRLKNGIGKTILLGLEVLVAGDIIITVIGVPSLEHTLTLAIIIIIRTLLSFSLHIEIDEKLPWNKK